MSVLKPGIYKGKVRGVPTTVLLDCGKHGYYVGDDRWMRTIPVADITDARPLIVLDINALSARNIAQILRSSGYAGVADQIEAQCQPARIPEPGLWGVVQSTRRGLPGLAPIDTSGRWVRVALSACPWVHEGTQYTAEWSDLIDPTLIREGLS